MRFLVKRYETGPRSGRDRPTRGIFQHALITQALYLMGGTPKSLWKESIDEDIREIVKQYGTDLGLKTRNLGNPGLAILESGEGANKRGLVLFYGASPGGHGHRDRLNIELFAFGRPMLPDIGYPSEWDLRHRFWVSHAVSHYSVLLDG